MYDMFSFAMFIHDLLFSSNVDDCNQDFLGDDFKSQGSHVPYNVTDFSTQVPKNLILFLDRARVSNFSYLIPCISAQVQY